MFARDCFASFVCGCLAQCSLPETTPASVMSIIVASLTDALKDRPDGLSFKSHRLPTPEFIQVCQARQHINVAYLRQTSFRFKSDVNALFLDMNLFASMLTLLLFILAALPCFFLLFRPAPIGTASSTP